MPAPAVGQPAPTFRLPSAQGPEIGPEDYRGQKNVIVWFSKGMACPFCRAHMSQLARGYDGFRRLDAEILQVTSSSPERARLYRQKFPLPFPYLCDPDYRVLREWTQGGVRSHSPFWYVRRFVIASRSEHPTSDFGDVKITPRELGNLLVDVDMGFFILDRQGVIRYSLSDSYVDVERRTVRPIPSNEEIVRELERCQAASSA